MVQQLGNSIAYGKLVPSNCNIPIPHVTSDNGKSVLKATMYGNSKLQAELLSSKQNSTPAATPDAD